MKRYKCLTCHELLPKDDFEWYEPEGKKDYRHKSCKSCEEFNVMGYDSWEKKYINTPRIQKFLKNLREVTGIYSPDDLIKRHRRW